MAEEDQQWMEDSAEAQAYPPITRLSPDKPVGYDFLQKLYSVAGPWGGSSIPPPGNEPTAGDRHRAVMAQHERDRLNAGDNYEYDDTQRRTEFENEYREEQQRKQQPKRARVKSNSPKTKSRRKELWNEDRD